MQGERVPYVLLQGHKKQDDAAEDPLLAAQEGRPPNVRLYWEVRWGGLAGVLASYV